ncbi:MAG: protein phosphatase, partial [Pseudomonadota bacterium]
MTLKGKIQAVSYSDTGLVRDHNEDAVYVQMDVGLVILADGMGGYNAGEVASEMAIKTVSNMVEVGLDKDSRGDID